MSKKRAMGLSINMVIIAAIGFIVLVIIAVIFKTQIADYANKYRRTADRTIESVEGGCVSPMFSGITRRCSEKPPDEKGNWVPVEGNCVKKEERCWELDKEESKNDATSQNG